MERYNLYNCLKKNPSLQTLQNQITKGIKGQLGSSPSQSSERFTTVYSVEWVMVQASYRADGIKNRFL